MGTIRAVQNDVVTTFHMIIYQEGNTTECWIRIQESCMPTLTKDQREIARLTFTGKARTARGRALQKTRKRAKEILGKAIHLKIID